MTEYTSSSSAADKVGTNDDLLIEILIHLPIRSLIKFKSVSKHWHSLITSPYFSRRPYRPCSTPSGLFLLNSPQSSSDIIIPEIYFIPLENETNRPPNDTPLSAAAAHVCSFPGLSRINIFHSCNGLLSCLAYTTENDQLDNSYHIYNPTTKKFITLPQFISEGVIKRDVWSLCLAFDPLKSPHYKVVCVLGTEKFWHYQIEIYSSETGNWRVSGGVFYTQDTQFDDGVYWNGAINWINEYVDSLYFNIDEERLGKLPLRSLRCEYNNYWDTPYTYFGESQGHLHLVEICNPQIPQFNVYELRRDYSEWFVKFSVDLNELLIAFPEMTLSHPTRMWEYYAYSILSLVRGEDDDEESFLVLHIPGQVISYKLGNRTFKKLCDFEEESYDGWPDVYEYIESLSSV